MKAERQAISESAAKPDFAKRYFAPFQRLWSEDRAAQMLEFALALPLLMVFVVGIFDFSSAYTLKQKLTNAARDAARTAAADPASDLGNTVPVSIVDAFEVIDNYFVANQINPCGIPNPPTMGPSGGLTWTMTGSSGCPPGGLVITINRGYYFPSAQPTSNLPAATNCVPPQSPGSQTSIIATCVSIQYAYQWQFGRVVSLLGGNSVLPSSLTAIAVAINEN